ncbi:unnamed protein product [Owenia fusiformis]|uniref:Uncharacterized protein n=1 Tax=Owenia fusiformis TaxID=6347 RepID=A0A8J1USI0_OWEFU|nr:unnamed protein product [Owenia fusiformis]
MGSKRIGQVCRLKPEHYAVYKEMHANVWPEILNLLTKVNIRNYSIYYCNKTHLLFFTMEYIGDDFDNDMAIMSKDPKFKECLIHIYTHCKVIPVKVNMSREGTTPSKRLGAIIKLRPEQYDKYKELHAAVWPEVQDRLTKSNVRNFTIYYDKTTGFMFHHMEYIGADFDADMAAIGDDPITRKWWKECEPCQEPLQWTGPPPSEGGSGGEGGAWWKPMEELFHDGHSAVKFL